MLKLFSHFFAYLLLVLMPFQSFAAANMAACNSLMQAEKSAEHVSKQAQNMPCHQHATNKAQDKDTSSENHKNTCKATCATLCASLCASLCAMTTIPSNIQPASFLAASVLLSQPHQSYASITSPNLQRPPIFLA